MPSPYMCYNFFIHSSVDEQLGDFHVLAIVNSAAVKIGVRVSLSVLVSLGCMPSSRSAGSYGSSIPSFLWTSPHMTTGKTIAFTIWTFVGKMMSLHFNTLSSFVIAILPRSERLLISWLQSLSAVILEPKKIKSITVSIVFPFICPEVMGLDAMIFIL